MFVVQLLKINQSMHYRMMKTKTHILGSNVEPSKLNHAIPSPASRTKHKESISHVY